MEDDQFLLHEFQKILRRNRNEPVVNLDDHFPHKFEFFSQTYEEIIRKVGTRIPPHKWSYHRIGLVRTGYAEFTCGIYKFIVKKNTMVMIPAGVINTSDWSAETTGYLVVFNVDFLLQNNFSHKYMDDKKILRSSVRPYVHLSEEQALEMEAVYKKILSEKKSAEPHNSQFIALKLMELMILADRLSATNEEADTVDFNSASLVKEFSELVEQHFLKERKVSFYASKLSIHPNYLNSLVKTNTGFTAKDSIQNRVLLEAKYLLHSTNLSIKEVANEMGFDDPNYFTAFFKRHEKLSPASYRLSFV